LLGGWGDILVVLIDEVGFISPLDSVTVCCYAVSTGPERVGE
jgi:hypothetical protein